MPSNANGGLELAADLAAVANAVGCESEQRLGLSGRMRMDAAQRTVSHGSDCDQDTALEKT